MKHKQPITLDEKRIHELYARIPSSNCKGLCQECCGPVSASNAEIRLLKRKGIKLDSKHLTCKSLKDGRCSIYSDRPVICRLWGATEKMPCPFGCQPDRMLKEDESYEIIASLERLP